MFTPKAVQNRNRWKCECFPVLTDRKIGGRIWQFGGRFLSNQSWKISSEFDGRIRAS